ILLAAHGVVWAQGGASSTGSSQAPFDLTDPSIVQAGSRLFRLICTLYCHTPEGRAARAPALRGRSELSPEFIYQRIVRGSPPMPAYGTTLSAEQIWTLGAYIESLTKAKECMESSPAVCSTRCLLWPWPCRAGPLRNKPGCPAPRAPTREPRVPRPAINSCLP